MATIICQVCAESFEGPRRHKKRCPSCQAKWKTTWARERYRNNPAVRASSSARELARRERDPEASRRSSRDRNRRIHRADRLEALDRYGGTRCACCGVTEPAFLTLQHSNGDGHAHRISLGVDPRTGSSAMVRRLRIAGWPDVPGLIVLCWNCHMAEDLHGGCPHKVDSTDSVDDL